MKKAKIVLVIGLILSVLVVQFAVAQSDRKLKVT
jgi:hypothetical protein